MCVKGPEKLFLYQFFMNYCGFLVYFMALFMKMHYVANSVVVFFLGTRLDLYSCASLFLKIQNSKSTNLAGFTDGPPIHNTVSKTKTPFTDRSILQRSFTQLAFDASLVFTDCSAIATATCDLRARCAAAVRSHNTTPPLRPRRGLTPLGGRHMVAEQAQKKNFWSSTCAGYRSIIVVETHTLRCKSWYTCRQRLIHTPCSTLPRLCLGGSCRRQLRQAHCTGAVPTARLWARPTIHTITLGTAIEAGCPADKQPTGLYICQLNRTYEGSRYH